MEHGEAPKARQAELQADQNGNATGSESRAGADNGHATDLESHELEKGKREIKSRTSELPPELNDGHTGKPPELPSNTLHFPQESRIFLEDFVPHLHSSTDATLPWVTLTYATSMDSELALSPGVQTILSGPESKAMTHYLRSRHDAILIGVGTAVADDPALNCRIAGAGGYGGSGLNEQPRPVVVDPNGRWSLNPSSRILRTVTESKGRAPWIVTSAEADVGSDRIEMLKHYGGEHLGLPEQDARGRLRWEAIFRVLAAKGIRSVMIEGGGIVINELLSPEYARFINSVIVTIAPTYLGIGGVVVSPERRMDESERPTAALRFRDVKWHPLGEDVVMCGKVEAPS